MPLLHISLRAGKPEAYRQAICDGLHRAMRETFGVPGDVLVSVVEGERGNWSFANGLAQYAT